MERLDCEALRAATQGCEVVLLVATGGEAAVLRQSMPGATRLVVATKEILVGELAPLGPRSPRDGPLPDGGGAGRRVVLAISGCDKVNAAHILTCLLQAMGSAPRLVLQTGIAGALPRGRGVAPDAAPDAALGAAVGGQVGPEAWRAGTGSAAGVGDVVIATQEAYSDTGSSSPFGWLSARELGWPIGLVGGNESGGVFPCDARLVEAAHAFLTTAWGPDRDHAGAAPAEGTRVLVGPCVTASLVTGLASEARAVADRWGALAESMEGAAAAHICALYGTPFLEVRGISNLVGDRDRGSWDVETAVSAASWAVRTLVDALDGLPLGKVDTVAEAPPDGEPGAPAPVGS